MNVDEVDSNPPQKREPTSPQAVLRPVSYQEWWVAPWFRTWLTLAGHSA
jgi:hypothetical protein